MSEPSTGSWITEFVGWIIGGLFTIAGAIMTLMNRYSKTALNRARDSDEVHAMADKNARIDKLEEDNDRLARERNQAVSELGGLKQSVRYLGEQLEAMRTEQRQRSDTVLTALNKRTIVSDHLMEDISKKVDANTDVTEQARDRADAAYKEANTVNKKIASVGLMARDGSKIAPAEVGDESEPIQIGERPHERPD